MFDSREIRGGGDGTHVNREAGVLSGVGPAVCENDVVGVAAWAAEHQIAALENGDCVSEDEIDGAVDVALPVELAVGVGEEGVLVSRNAATVEDGTIRSDVQSHGLSAFRTCVVVEPHVSSDEPITGDCCNAPQLNSHFTLLILYVFYFIFKIINSIHFRF